MSFKLWSNLKTFSMLNACKADDWIKSFPRGK